MTTLLRTHGVTKSFGGPPVLRGIDLEVRAGRVHALLGPNGAGKSTLIKIWSGVHRPDRGTVEVTAADGGRGRIGFIHQDLGLVDELTVTDNLFLSRGGLTRGRLLAGRREHQAAIEQLHRVDLDIDPRTRLGDLSLGQKTMVAIARLLADDADVIVLDEVTAALNRTESEWLLTQVRQYVAGGRAAILVSHRLHEVTVHCDDTTVVKDGALAYTGLTPDLATLHDLLTVTAAIQVDRTPTGERAPLLLTAAGLRAAGVGPVDLQVRSGEVVGLVGPLSSNPYAVGHLLAGATHATGGTLTLQGKDGRPGRAGLVPEDRLGQAALATMTVASNVTVSALRRFRTRGLLHSRPERAAALAMIDRMAVRPDHAADLPITSLSGGNQQKAVLGRVALDQPDVYILCEPTRGVDVPTRHAVYRFVEGLRSAGAAVVIVTIDVDDAMAVADRIHIVDDGRLGAALDRNDLTATDLLERVS